MSATNKEHPFLIEFRDFTKFLNSLWGILAGVSVFFPLSNVLLKIIPLGYIADEGPGALEFLSPKLITTLTTVAALFIILQTFHQRGTLRTRKQKNVLQHQGWISFGIGMVALLVYLVVAFGIYWILYEPLGIWSGDLLRVIGDILLLLSYGVFFAQLTRAFVLLGMLEYFSKAKK